MTIREGIHRIKRMLREVNADSRLTDRTVYSLMRNHAKWLIYRESEKLKILKSDKIFQKLKCVKVIEAPLIDPCCGLKSTCTIFRTKEKLPEIYEDSFGVIILNVTTIDGSKSLTLIKPSEWERKVNNPWINKNNKNNFYFYSDGYLYFPNGSWKMIELVALFKTDISEMNLCDDKNECDTVKCKRFLDEDFVIPEYLEAQMYDLVIRDLLNTYKKTPEKSNSINKNDNT